MQPRDRSRVATLALPNPFRSKSVSDAPTVASEVKLSSRNLFYDCSRNRTDQSILQARRRVPHGTEPNLISFEHFEALDRTMDKCEKPMTSTVGNGETVDVMGQTEFKFRSPKRKERRWMMTFYVVKGLPYEVSWETSSRA